MYHPPNGCGGSWLFSIRHVAGVYPEGDGLLKLMGFASLHPSYTPPILRSELMGFALLHPSYALRTDIFQPLTVHGFSFRYELIISSFGYIVKSFTIEYSRGVLSERELR